MSRKASDCSRGRSLQERLDALSIPEPNSGCLLWTGTAWKDGYGVIRIDDKMVRAHRLVWSRAHGPIPDGLVVCHKCDVRACINLDHLWLGTHQDNVRDRVKKGRNGPRNSRGIKNGQAKLSEIEVLAILRDARSQQAIADTYGIHQSTVSLIKRGKNWAHLQ